MGNITIAQALQYGRQQLTTSPTPDIDSQFLLCHTLSCASSYLHMWPEKRLDTQAWQHYQRSVQQRQAGVPVAYITGQQGFWRMTLRVTPATLIPRPETEIVVEQALAYLQDEQVVADLGTGSGAIAIALALECPRVQVLAMDYSASALAVAQDNARQYQLQNIRFWQGSWLDAVKDHSLDMIVSNPPYIERDDPHLLQGDVRHEPDYALVAQQNGLADIASIIDQGRRCLVPGGRLILEHGYQQAVAVKTVLQRYGYQDLRSYQDYGGHDRVMSAQWPG